MKWFYKSAMFVCGVGVGAVLVRCGLSWKSGRWPSWETANLLSAAGSWIALIAVFIRAFLFHRNQKSAEARERVRQMTLAGTPAFILMLALVLSNTVDVKNPALQMFVAICWFAIAGWFFLNLLDYESSKTN